MQTHLIVPELRNYPEFDGTTGSTPRVSHLIERAVAYGMVRLPGVNILLSADQHIDATILAQAAQHMAEYLKPLLTGYAAQIKGGLHGRDE